MGLPGVKDRANGTSACWLRSSRPASLAAIVDGTAPANLSVTGVPTGNPIRLVSLRESVDACGAMIDLCKLILCAFARLFRSRAELEAEILVLRHQPSQRLICG